MKRGKCSTLTLLIMAIAFSVSGNCDGGGKSALKRAIKSWLSWIRGPVNIKTREFGNIFVSVAAAPGYVSHKKSSDANAAGL